MMKGRRVGTLTCGISLVVFGVLCFLRMWMVEIDYLFILSLWPLILIFLGVETIAFFLLNREDKLRYDGGSIAIIIVLSLFAIMMASAQLFLQQFPALF